MHVNLPRAWNGSATRRFVVVARTGEERKAIGPAIDKLFELQARLAKKPRARCLRGRGDRKLPAQALNATHITGHRRSARGQAEMGPTKKPPSKKKARRLQAPRSFAKRGHAHRLENKGSRRRWGGGGPNDLAVASFSSRGGERKNNCRTEVETIRAETYSSRTRGQPQSTHQWPRKKHWSGLQRIAQYLGPLRGRRFHGIASSLSISNPRRPGRTGTVRSHQPDPVC